MNPSSSPIEEDHDTLDEVDSGVMKENVNEFLFRHLPGTTTIDRMNELACQIWGIIMDEYKIER